MFASIGDTFFSIGALSIKYYGIILAIAILVGFFAVIKISKKFYSNIDIDFVYDISPILILGAILGARLYYVILDFDYYSKHLNEIFAIWQGGISIHGAILGGLITIIILFKKYKKTVLPYLDVFSFGMILGQSIGRWGNFFNSEAFGSPCDLPWKLFIPLEKRPLEFIDINFFHPTFLYESILDFLIFLILLFIVRKFVPKINGIIFFSYLILYSFARIAVESLRLDSVLNIGSIPIAIIVSFILIIVGTGGLSYVLKFQSKK